MLVGYRWFDTKHIAPQFPFGFGLSYTTFAFSNLRLKPAATGVTAEFEITNTGPVAGAEVAQLYVHPENPGVVRPDKELKGFKKIFLQPGETQTIDIPLTMAAFAYYSPADQAWIAAQGEYKIRLGSSSRDLPQEADFTLPQTTSFK